MYNFEIEHWPDYFGKHALRRTALGYVKGALLLAAITLVLFALYFFTHITILRWVVMGFGFVTIFSPLLIIVSYLQRNKKVPSYGLTKDGFLLNERGWDAAFFTWDEIKDVKEFDHPKFGKELHFEFVSFTKALNKEGQNKFEQALRREYEIAKEPKKISPQLVKGDLTEFIERFQNYYKAYKRKHPISSEEAFEIARSYIKEHGLSLEISSKKCELKDHIDGLEGAFYVFPIQNHDQMELLVSLQKKAVEAVRSTTTLYYPHQLTNNLSVEESKAIVAEHLGNHPDTYKIIRAYFQFGGLYEYPNPCWIVQVKNLKAKLDGETMTDYVLDADSKAIITSLTT